jgi:excisionase family DNA binding protein
MDQLILSPVPLADLVGEITKAVCIELDARTPHATPPPEELLTRVEAAQLLGITLPTLREYTRRGHVTGYRIGTRVRYRRNEVLNDLRRIRTAKTARS